MDKDQLNSSWALLWEFVSQTDGQLLLLDVQALGLMLTTKLVATEAATRSPTVLATSMGPTVTGYQEEAQKTYKKGMAEMKKTVEIV